MQVVLTEAALADLIRIGQAIRQDSPARAKSFVAELYDRCLQLAEMPRAFPLLPRHRASGVRRRVYGNYLIFYWLNGETIEVLHVLHGAQDYEALLFLDA